MQGELCIQHGQSALHHSRCSKLLYFDIAGLCTPIPTPIVCQNSQCCVGCQNRQYVRIQQLLKHPKYSKDWSTSSANEFGRLAQGIGGRVKATNTIFFIDKTNVPRDRFKDCTYRKFVCMVRPQKAEPNQTRLTVGGNRINYPGKVGTPTADMLLMKIMLNSVVSTLNAKFMSIDISNFYLNTPLPRYQT